MGNIITRLAGINDRQLIADMSRQTFYDTFAMHNSKENMDKFMNEQFTPELLLEEVGAPGNIFLLAYDDGQPAGYVRMREYNNPPELGSSNAIEIARIYALPSAIGRGVGKKLMQECINIAQEKKKEALWLGVWEKNLRAIEFYAKWGFEKFATHVFMLGDDAQTDWLMKKSLI
jgi:diamine N-acetyltransferase